ncbi:hypothetical protein H4CHR_02882 [Variovorax sp. PBS-H4]|uniref:hypothetical protein n=1 Tax=Variovorax sp. PBS-H4 TaxID=434008 RepID=UPI0013173DBA|nr:hypothetical protein [Variovorax sp. PBS-H4]VTU31803.1 hypothetical protein H4CHR_02882 [Variovorax sp. PBS-H4]
MAHFTLNQERILKRIEVFRDEITAPRLCDAPCELLASQLEELIVMTDRLRSNARELLKGLPRSAL